MSTFGHLAVGAAIGRVTGPSDRRGLLLWMAWVAFVAIAPDLDFIGVWFFGVGPGSTWNHRAATHSMMIAGGAGGLLSLLMARKVGLEPRLAGAVGLLAGATHPILDGVSLQSAGSPLWWPWSQDFWQARLRFLPGVLDPRDYLTGHGLGMLALELVWFSPFLWIAFRRRSGQKKTGGP